MTKWWINSERPNCSFESCQMYNYSWCVDFKLSYDTDVFPVLTGCSWISHFLCSLYGSINQPQCLELCRISRRNSCFSFFTLFYLTFVCLFVCFSGPHWGWREERKRRTSSSTNHTATVRYLSLPIHCKWYSSSLPALELEPVTPVQLRLSLKIPEFQ